MPWNCTVYHKRVNAMSNRLNTVHWFCHSRLLRRIKNRETNRIAGSYCMKLCTIVENGPTSSKPYDTPATSRFETWHRHALMTGDSIMKNQLFGDSIMAFVADGSPLRWFGNKRLSNNMALLSVNSWICMYIAIASRCITNKQLPCKHSDKSNRTRRKPFPHSACANDAF